MGNLVMANFKTADFTSSTVKEHLLSTGQGAYVFEYLALTKWKDSIVLILFCAMYLIL